MRFSVIARCWIVSASWRVRNHRCLKEHCWSAAELWRVSECGCASWRVAESLLPDGISECLSACFW